MQIIIKCPCGAKTEPMDTPPVGPPELGVVIYHCRTCGDPIAWQDRV